MDVSYQSLGGYVPHYTPCRGFLEAGSPSPPTSLCSEPVLPVPDGRNIASGLQLKTSRLQLLNKTVVDARRKKNTIRGHNLAPRFETPEMGNFFQNAMPFPDHTSDSGDSSMKGLPESPQFRYWRTPYMIPSSLYHWQQLDASFQYPHSEQRQLGFVQVENPLIPNYQFQQETNNIGPPFLRQGKTESTAVSDAQDKMDKNLNLKDADQQNSGNTKIDVPKNDKVSKKKNPKPFTSKKAGLITTIKANVKKERTKHNLMLRKQRKRIQQKNKSLHKTELCTHWMLTSTCNFKGKCYFAHGIDELRKRVRLSNYKTKPCVDCPPQKGRCSFGSRCNYCHPGEAIRRAVSSTYFDIDYYKDLKKEFKDNEYPFGIFI